jgi:hypothetical protein
VLIAVSGCAAPVAPSDAATEPLVEARPALSFLPGRAAATVPNTQHEAFVDVSDDGQTILTCAHGFFKDPSHFYASTDGGATFVELRVDEPMPGGGDCEVALSASGVWAFSEKTDLGVTVVTTADGGTEWTVNHLAGPPVNGLADRQWLAYAGEVLWLSHQPGSQQVGTVEAMRSSDHGATWSLPSRVLLPDPAYPKVHAGPFLFGPDGSVRIPVERSAPDGATALSLAVSSDDGSTWTEQTLPVGDADSETNPFPSGVTQAADGAITWAYAAGSSLVVIGSTDGGATWSPRLVLDDGLDWGRPAAAARPDGSVDVVWLSDGARFGVDGPHLALARVDLRATPAEVETTVLGPLGSIEFVDVAHDAAGRATVVATAAGKTTQNPLGTGEVMLYQEAAGSLPSGPPSVK